MIDTSTALPGLSEVDALGSLTIADAGRFRFVVTPDPEADGPFQWGHLVAVDVVRAYGGHAGDRFEYGADDLGLADALAHFCERIAPEPGHWANPDAAVEAARRWARIFHGVEVTRWQAHGVSQSDWSDALVYLASPGERAASTDDQQQALDGWLTDAACWYRGEVVGIRLERETEEGDWITAPDCDVWGFYGVSTARDAAETAAEAYGLPRDFALAVPVTYEDVAW